MKPVSVIIAHWNKKAYLKDCLESLLRQTYPAVEIIVVDNGSRDGSSNMLKEEYPQIKLILNSQNKLYCRAQNQGMKIAQGEYIISLNNDVILERDFIKELVETADMDQRIGMVCGKIISWDKAHIDSAGQMLARSRKPLERGYKNKDKDKFNQPGYVFSPSGVAPLYKRKMLEEIKLDGEYFDESYGIFYEDLDLAWRANRLGWRAFYNPRACAYHRRGGTAKTETPAMPLLKRYDFAYLSPQLKVTLVKNRYSTILKNDSPLDFLINLPWIIGYEAKLWLYFIFFEPALVPQIFKNINIIKVATRKRTQIKCLQVSKSG